MTTLPKDEPFLVEDGAEPIYNSEGYIINSEIGGPGERTPTRGRFSINTFMAEIAKNDILPTHSYLVTFSPFRINSLTGKYLSSFTEDSAIGLRCDTAILPGIRLLKNETVYRYGYGPIERVAYSAQFNDIQMTWIVDNRGNIMEFFNRWMQAIVNFDSAGTNDMRTPNNVGGLSYSPYEVGYKDDYACPKMNIHVYDSKLNSVITYEIYDVFPSAINDVPVAWGEQDTMMRLSVEFSYTDIKILTPRSSLTGVGREVVNIINGDQNNSSKYRSTAGILKLIGDL